MIHPRDRQRFDDVLEEVLDELPVEAHRLLDLVPLVVEDYPSQKIVDDMGLAGPDELCGLYSGIPLIERSVEVPPYLSDCVTIYRLGLLRMGTNEAGRVVRAELKRQIRITILHELGHYHGLDEQDLEELGFG
jgi:predicted Zn-dependent protease with MMP-like domain